MARSRASNFFPLQPGAPHECASGFYRPPCPHWQTAGKSRLPLYIARPEHLFRAGFLLRVQVIQVGMLHQRSQGEIMNILDAAHRIGHEYPGGAGVLADRLGINRVVFNSRLNPNLPSHHLSLLDSLRMQQLAGRQDVLHAMASELGFVCIPAGAYGGVSDAALLDLFSTMIQRLGDFSRAFHEALSDGRVTEKEFEAIRTEFYSLQAAGAELLSRVESLTEKRPTSNATSSK